MAWAVAAPWLVFALVRVLGLDRGHPLVAVVAFTAWIAAASPVPVVVALVLRRRSAAVAAVVAAVLLVAVVAPRALGGPEPAPNGSRELTVMTANLYFGRADPRAVLRLVDDHDVDLLSLQEVSPQTIEALDAAGARRRLPGRVGADGTWNDRNALLTTAALRPRGDPADAVLPGGLRVTTVHPVPPISAAKVRSWRRDLGRVPPTGGRDGLRIVLGDFNATLDHRALRRVLDRGYEDAAAVAGKGLSPTWPRLRRRPQVTIDHVLVDRRVAVRAVWVRDVAGSDHRAVIARLAVPRR